MPITQHTTTREKEIKHCTMANDECKNNAEMIREVHLAVCGNEKLGVDGLVVQMHELMEWRKKIDLRVAKITGAVCGTLWLIDKVMLK